MATIQMRKNKNGLRVFRIRVKVDGIEYQKTWPDKAEEQIPATWSDKRARTEATKAASFFEDECKRGLVSNNRQTLSDYARYVIDLKESTGAIKPKTVAEYRKQLARIDAAKLGKLHIKNITVKDLNAFYKELTEDTNKHTGAKLAPRTIRIYHALISSVLGHAAKEQIINYNPALYATLPKTEHKEANYYTPDKMRAIMEAVNKEPLYWQAMTYLFIGTGARRGEILGLQWSDIDFENCTISIQRNVIYIDGDIITGTPKTGETRQISIDPEFLKPLASWRIEQARHLGVLPLSGYCFAVTDPCGPLKPDTVTRYYARLGARYNLGKINPHAFRHSQASMLLQDGDIITASKRLGHAQTSTTMNIYGHMMPKTDKAAAAKIGAALFKKG